MRATPGEIARGVKIFEGKLTADPVKAVVRPSTEQDLSNNFISNFSPEKRSRYVAIAVRNLARGPHAYATAAAGASARQPIKEAPATLRALAGKIHGTGHSLQSKAAVPVGEYEGQAYSFLGLLLADVAGLEKEVGAAIPGAKPNKVLIMTNPDYQDELDNELRHNRFYGVAPEQFIRHAGRVGYQQDLGPKYYLNEKDAEKVLNLILDKNSKTPEERAALLEKLKPVYEASLQKAREVRAAILAGEPEKVVHPSERDPLGHLEFFNQMVSKGVLLNMIDQGVETLSFRNIDNAAATYTEDFLVIYGYMLDNKLDAVLEVSRRGAGMKGGGWLIDEQGNHQIAEDPTIDATWKLILTQYAGEGWTRKLQVLEKDDKREMIPASDLENFRALLRSGQSLTIEPTRLSFIEEKIKSVEELDALVPSGKDAKIAVFEDKDGKIHIVRKVTSADTSAINDAVAIFSLGYILDCYRLPGQSRKELVQEMRAAKAADTLEEIAERGRIAAPLLWDPKPARDESVIGLGKTEGNMWQTTGTVTDATKVEAIVVKSTQDIDIPAFDKLATADEQVDRISDFRFLATKQWKGIVESYEANTRFFKALFRRIFNRPRFDPKVLERRDLSSRPEEGWGLKINSTPLALQLLRGGLNDRGAHITVSEGFEIKNGGELVVIPEEFRKGVDLFIGNNVVIDGIHVHLRLGGDNKVIIDGGTQLKVEGLTGFKLELTLKKGEWLHINPPVLADVITELKRDGKEAVFATYQEHVAKNELNKAFFIRQIVKALASRPSVDRQLVSNAQWVKEQIDAFEAARAAAAKAPAVTPTPSAPRSELRVAEQEKSVSESAVAAMAVAQQKETEEREAAQREAIQAAMMAKPVSRVMQPAVTVAKAPVALTQAATAVKSAELARTMETQVVSPLAGKVEARMTAKIDAMMKELGLEKYRDKAGLVVDKTRLVVSYERLGLDGMIQLRHENPKATIVVVARSESRANAEADIMGYDGFELAPSDNLAVVAQEQLKAFDLKLQPGEVSKSVVQVMMRADIQISADEIKAYREVAMPGILAFFGFNKPVSFATPLTVAEVLSAEVRAAASIAKSA